jgi:hypothetical protein
LKAPPVSLARLEMRAAFEYMAFMASLPSLLSMGGGDGHPVMVLPPFMGDDTQTAPPRWVLDGQGYAVHGWRQGSNLSRTPKIVAGLPHRLLELHERHGAKVSLVGHSGGGNWARDLARAWPFAVRQVITLGAPFRLRPGDATQADQLADMMLKDQVPQDPSALIDEEDRPPLSVPVTAIYSRTDGVAPGTPASNRRVRGASTSKWSAATAGSPTTPRRLRHRRPPRPARRDLAALPATGVRAPALPHPRLLATELITPMTPRHGSRPAGARNERRTRS